MNFNQHNLFACFAASAAKRWRYSLGICVLMTAAMAGAISFQPRGARAEQTAPGLRDAAAIEQLKQNGQYESLQAAFNQVRAGITLQQGLTAGDGAQFDLFGHAVALSGNTAIIGAPGASVAQGDQGAAYVFVRNGANWTLQTKLFAQVGVVSEAFGTSVAIDGNTAIIGATPLDPDSPLLLNGAAYVFVRNGTTWSQQQRLIAADGHANALFGATVAIDGNTALVGSPEHKPANAPAATGATYVFVRTGAVWSQQQKLLANDAAVGDQFGAAVAIDADTAIIGAPKRDVGANADQGAAYVFTRNGTVWTQQPRLTSGNGAVGDSFGNAISISGDKALIGASLYGADDSGAVYFFKRGAANWTEADAFNSPFPKANGHFGEAVSLDGNAAVIGASLGLFENGADRREAYIFVNASNVWGFTRQLDLDLGTADDRFGYAVAIEGDVVLAGAYRGNGAVASAGAAYAFVMRDSRYVESPRILAADGAGDDRFGKAVAMDGDTLVIGAWYDDIGPNTDQGSVYVYVRNGANWVFQQKLLAPSGAAGDLFGTSVAVTGDLLVAGSPGYDNGTAFDIGAAYLFKRFGTTWVFQQKLMAAELESDEGDTFGDSVAIHGRTIAVGATGASDSRGAVYTFRATNDVWFEEMKIAPNDSSPSDFFGYSISLYNDTLAIGTPLHTPGTKLNQGAVYVYVRSGTAWPLQKKIADTLGSATDYFGAGVSLHGETLAIGAPATDSVPARLGTTYVFNRVGTNWAQQAKFNANDGQENDGFGISVSLRNDLLAVGSLRSTTTRFSFTGRAYVFTRIGGWHQQQKLIAANRSTDDRYGSAVAISGDAVAVGAYSTSIGSKVEQGAVYVFSSPTCPAISITPLALPNATAGVSYSQQLAASGGATADYQFVLSRGALPPGLTLNEAGLLQGTPSAGGIYRFTVTARHTLSQCPGSREYTITVSASCPTITVNPATLPNGMVGAIYNQTITASGGTAPHSFAVSAGALPGGLTLTTGGTLTGTPVIAGAFNFSITATDANGCTGSRSYSVTISNTGGGGGTTGLQFYPLAHPVRLLETRAGQSGCFTPGAPIAAGTSRTQPARGLCDGLTIPANAQAVTGNITTVNSGGGFLTLYPSNAAQPLVANTNYGPNEIVNNVFTVGLGNDGAFKIFALNATDVVVDVTGYYAPPPTSGAGGLYFHPLPKPIRLLETRAGQTGCSTPGTPLTGGAATLQLGQTTCGGVTIPAEAQALVGNATTVGPQSGGYLTLYPANAAQPLVASSNFQAGQVMNAPFTVGLSPSGHFNIFTTTATDLVIDVQGYYSAQLNDVNGAGLLLYSLPSPTRLLDTRAGQAGCFTPGAPLLGNATSPQPAIGACTAIPATAKAIVGNATVVNPQSGYLTFWPSNAQQPLVATSNYLSGQVFNRHFTVGLGADGAFKMFASATTDLVIDLTGYFAP